MVWSESKFLVWTKRICSMEILLKELRLVIPIGMLNWPRQRFFTRIKRRLLHSEVPCAKDENMIDGVITETATQFFIFALVLGISKPSALVCYLVYQNRISCFFLLFHGDFCEFGVGTGRRAPSSCSLLVLATCFLGIIGFHSCHLVSCWCVLCFSLFMG